MKKHVAELVEKAENEEHGFEEDEEDGLPSKPKKTQMCKDILEGKVCKHKKSCKFAHNPIQLELVPISKKIQNLNAVVTSQSRLLHQNQTVDAWIPPNKHIGIDSKYRLAR